MAQRPFPLPVQADKRVSQVSQISDFSVTSNSSDARRHKVYIGPWKLGKTLGKGSSGRVRLAKHTITGKLAAIKIVPKITASTMRPNGKGRPHEKIGGLPYGIEREVVIMKLIDHPNIMRLYDVWENKHELYLVLEYVEEGELFDYLVQRKRLPEWEAVDYIQQIISAVDYCHRFNICHRDLKPENLLLDRNKRIKVADFGMASLETAEQLLHTACGSPHYASPEIVAGKDYHGGPSDIWSCGIILFALLTGYLPIDDEDIRVLLAKVKVGYFIMPDNLSPEAKDLLWKMLQVDPVKRIKMDELLVHPLILKYRPSKGPRLPRAPTYQELIRPVNSVEEIEREILRNLQTLWRGAPKELIIKKLLSPEQNAEKTFYLLLLKYRHDRLENYGGDEERAPRMPKSASRKSVRSAHSKKSASSRRGHHKSASRGSKMSATSSHRRGVSFGAAKKKTRDSPPVPSEAVIAPPIEREVINYTLPRRESPSKRVLTATPAKYSLDDESTRKMSAEFSQFLDLAFNTSSSAATTVLEDPETYQARPLPRIPLDPYRINRPGTAEPAASSKIDAKQRAHKSAEVAAPLPRIFEEERDRYADAEEEQQRAAAAAAAAKENLTYIQRPKAVKGYSYPAKPRAALGELSASNVHNAASTSAAAAAMKNFPMRRQGDKDAQRVSSLVEQEAPKAQSAGRRFFSAPSQYHRNDKTNVDAEPSTLKKSWLGRKLSSMTAKKTNVSAAESTAQMIQQSPPGHAAAAANVQNLAARRAAPPPPRLELSHDRQQQHQQEQQQEQRQDSLLSPPFPHPSTFSPSPVLVKQSFFARILGVKPANRVVHTTYHPTTLQREIAGALEKMERNDKGVRVIENDRRTRLIRARLAKRNNLGLKAVRFRIEVRDFENGSQAVFHLEQGANSSFNKIADRCEDVLRASNVFVEVRGPSRLSAYAL